MTTINCVIRLRALSTIASLASGRGKNVFLRRFATERSSSSIAKAEGQPGGQVQPSLGEVVKENTKSAWYLAVIVGGVSVTALTFYAVCRELFSGQSPQSVYTKAIERCLENTQVLDALGEPIKAYGEETRRGRRGHVRHTVYTYSDKKYMRMQFYLQGQRKKGTVHLEVKEDDSGKFVYRYMFVQLDDLLRNVIVVEDNRAAEMESNKIEDIPPFNFPVVAS